MSWPGYKATGSPDHLYYSVSRRGYVSAQELQVGELLRTDLNTVAPVQAVSPPRYEMRDLYNVEVEHFHNYHVGQPGGSAVLVHNGTQYIQTLKGYDLVDEVKSSRTLLLGEGNMTFAQALARKGRIDPRKLTVTTLEEEHTWSPEMKAIAESLRGKGATIMGGVDARKLGETFGDSKFDTILWNFPLGPAPKNQRGLLSQVNRELMTDFFGSASGQLAPNGKVVLTLHERCFKAWQVSSAASTAGFGSPSMAPYQLGGFPSYRPMTTYQGVNQPVWSDGRTYIFPTGGQ